MSLIGSGENTPTDF